MTFNPADYMDRCPYCEGTGQVYNNIDLGIALAQERRDRKVQAGTMAKRLGFSGAYICDLEHGRRNWSHDLVKRYTEALEATV